MVYMTGNTFGKIFRVTTFGESHGDVIGCVIDGCPSGILLNQEDIQIELDRRKPGKNRYVSQRREKDEVKILSGLFQGKTTGAPIALLIENQDTRESDYENLANVFRPGHADFSYHKKYGHYDYRGGGRASARETAMRVAAGAIAKKYLKEKENILVRGYLAQMGELKISEVDWHEVENNAFFCPDKKMISQFEEYIQTLLKQGDSIGAKIYVEALNVPAGLGEPVFDKLDAEIAKVLMSINAVKAVEIGSGFDCVMQNGSEHRDEITPDGFLSNHAGGILGGISTGQTIYANVAFKPTSSIRIPAKTITKDGEAIEVSVTGRHDPCVGIRATPIVEAMLALVLMDNYLLMRARK